MNRRLLLSAVSLIVLVGLLGGTRVEATGNLELLTQSNTKIANRLWATSVMPVPWHYNDPTTGAPPCNYSSDPNAPPAAALQPTALAAFNRWQNLPESNVTFTYAGTSTARNPSLDGINIVTFCSNTSFASGVLGQTPTFAINTPATVTAGGGCPAGKGPISGICFPVGSYPAGSIIDANTDINTIGNAEWDLTTVGTQGDFDLETLFTHEFGHFIGLSHDPIFDTTMYPFIDDVPSSDGIGQKVLKVSDASTTGRYYPAGIFSTNFGTITGRITLDGTPAHGVHVFAVDPNTMMGVAGRFSLSVFEDTNALGPDGPDFAANGAGFYRLDGLPPGDYFVMTEYFDDSDFISGRLANRYNTTVNNSNVSNGNSGAAGQVGPWLGFLPKLIEFYDTAAAGSDSGNAGDGLMAGTAVDNSDAATKVTVAAGGVVPGVNIAINIEPVNGQAAADRENPTTRATIPNDATQGTDRITAFLLNGGPNDYYGVRFPALSLPTPPYNVAEGLWSRGGRSNKPFVTSLHFEDPNRPGLPDLANPIVPSAKRVLSGGPSGAVAAGDFMDVRDQWNVTINQSRDVFVVLNQPESAPGISFLTQGYFYLISCIPTGSSCTSARVGRTLVTEDGGTTWFTITNGDVFYDLIVESTPPVRITGASPAALTEGQTADVDIQGTGFRSGATVSFGPNINVNNVTFISSSTLRANITVVNTGATTSRNVSVTVTNPEVVFPNVARVFAVDPLLDADLDGEPDATDCAPMDPTLKRPATAVTGIGVTPLGGGNFDVFWTSQDPTAGTGTTYDIVTGFLNDLIPSTGFGSATCAADNHPDSPLADSTALVFGQGQYFLIRATNGCTAGPGSFGISSAPVNHRAPLDAGTPCSN